MGNNPCGDAEGQLKVQLNAIHLKYKPDNQSSFKLVKKQYLKYPQKYPYILSYLNQENIKFVDEYFNGLRTPEVVLGSQFSHLSNNESVQFKRIDQLIREKSYTIHTVVTSFANHRVNNTYRVLNWVMNQPKIISNIFKIEELNKEGLILAYLPFYGSQTDPIEVIVDNYVPTVKGKYYADIPQFSSVGMIFLEKVLAKYLGSYEAVRNKKGIRLFQMLSGIPIISQNIGVQEEIIVLNKYYNQKFKLTCLQQNFQSKRPNYLKFSLHEKCLLSIAIWQFKESQYLHEYFSTEEIILELIKKNEQKGSYERIGYASKTIDNKTIVSAINPEEEKFFHIGKQLMNLQPGDYYVHIFSLSDNRQITGNIIIYSEHQTNAFYRKENSELMDMKKKMIESVFRKRISTIKSNIQQIECNNVRSRFIWDGYRGILQIINYSQTKVSINLSINPEYRIKIHFQLYDDYEINMSLGVKSLKIISFIKLKNIDIGRFYKIQLASNSQWLGKKITSIESPKKDNKY